MIQTAKSNTEKDSELKSKSNVVLYTGLPQVITCIFRINLKPKRIPGRLYLFLLKLALTFNQSSSK